MVRDRLADVLSKLRSSMWLVPSMMALTAFAAAVAISLADTRLQVSPELERFLFSGDAAGARAILSAIAASMINVTGVVFSITIVVLALATGQFGPRLLRNFMGDRGVQLVLGTFIATYVFCLISVRSVRAADGEGGAYLAVTVAVALAITSIGVLIFFIHHVASLIQADAVIARVHAELVERVDVLFPSMLGAPAETPPPLPSRFEAEAADVQATRTGHLRSFEEDELFGLAVRHDLVVRIVERPGRFVVRGDVVMRVWPPPDARTLEALGECVLVGDRRTAEQDIEFPILQLVEIASRALSPGINDPFTALACIDRLGATLVTLSARDMPASRRVDEQGALRVVADPVSYEGIVLTCFDAIRHYGRASPTVIVGLLATLERVARANAAQPTRARAVLAVAEQCLRSSSLESHEAEDVRRIEAGVARIRRAVPS